MLGAMSRNSEKSRPRAANEPPPDTEDGRDYRGGEARSLPEMTSIFLSALTSPCPLDLDA